MHCMYGRYVNGVKPGQYGVPRPFYFPFQPSYWLGRPLKSKKNDVSCLFLRLYSGKSLCSIEFGVACTFFVHISYPVEGGVGGGKMRLDSTGPLHQLFQ